MKLDLAELTRGFQEVIKEADGPMEPGVPHSSGGVSGFLGNMFVHPAQQIEQGVGGMVQKQLGGIGDKIMSGIGQLAPLAMLPMLASGMGGQQGQGAPAPGQPIQRISPINPAGFKYGHDKRALLNPALMLYQINETNKLHKKEEVKKSPVISSKDKDVQKTLGNPQVKDYIEGLVDTKK